MVVEELSEACVAFVREHISSIAKLEVLLLVRQHSARAWSANEVSQELRSAENASAQHLHDLARSGLLRAAPGEPPRYRYAPRADAQDAVVAQVARIYAERPHTLIEIVLASHTERPS